MNATMRSRRVASTVINVDLVRAHAIERGRYIEVKCPWTGGRARRFFFANVGMHAPLGATRQIAIAKRVKDELKRISVRAEWTIVRVVDRESDWN